MKQCIYCKCLKSLSCFHKRKDSADGHKNYCKECALSKQKERYVLNPEVREKAKNRARQQKIDNPNLSREEYQRNRQSYILRSRVWTEDNRERSREIKSSWKKRNPYQARKDRARRRELIGNNKIEEYEWEALLDWLGRRCLRCGDTKKLLTQDHVIPLSDGGPNCIWNIQPLCIKCNSTKSINLTDYRPGM